MRALRRGTGTRSKLDDSLCVKSQLSKVSVGNSKIGSSPAGIHVLVEVAAETNFIASWHKPVSLSRIVPSIRQRDRHGLLEVESFAVRQI